MFPGVACCFWLLRCVWEKLWESCSYPQLALTFAVVKFALLGVCTLYLTLGGVMVLRRP